MFVRIGVIYGLGFMPFFLLLTIKIPSIPKRFGILLVIFFGLSIPFFISTVIPFENLLFSFKSPQTMITYRNSGTVMDVVHGEDSSLIIYEAGNGAGTVGRMKGGNYESYGTARNWYSHTVVKKSSAGYKLPDMRQHITQKTPHRLDEYDRYFSVYSIVGTNDYFLYGTTSIEDNAFYIVYAHAASIDDLEDNLKKILVTLSPGEFPAWNFVE
jgi:hypothetical protein